MLFNFSTKMHSLFCEEFELRLWLSKDDGVSIIKRRCTRKLNSIRNIAFHWIHKILNRSHVNSEKCIKTVEFGINSQFDRSAGRIISNEIVSMPKKDDLFLVDRAIRDGKQSLVVSMESQS